MLAPLLAACASPIAPPRPVSAASGPVLITATADLPTIAPPPERSTPQSDAPVPTLILPTLTAFPDDDFFALGQSVEGRTIWAWQFGEGERTIVLVGGIHGGYEANTVLLSEMLVEHFRRSPEDVLPGIRLVIVPSANPDGTERGRGLEGRFNARGVDLNRNWGCEWSEEATLRERPVDPGPRPFSEPETLALRSFFISVEPDAVIFYHSAVGGVFMGACGNEPAAGWMGRLLAEATGYPYYREFHYYEVTGDASNWLAERGVPAAILELYSQDEPEFDENLRGVMALQCHFAGSSLVRSSDASVLRRVCAPYTE